MGREGMARAVAVPPGPGGGEPVASTMPTMVERPEQTGRIAVYGASGYTGRLVAAELDRRGASFVLSGRNREKLDHLSASLDSHPAVEPASLDDGAALRLLLADCGAVIDCAGPFSELGEPVVRAAIDTRTHYLDTAGEQTYIHAVLERFGHAAESEGVGLVPAMGFDYVPGDMLASLVAAGMGALEEVTLAYHVARFAPTQGTMLSALRMLDGGDVEWRGGNWLPSAGGAGRGTWSFPPPEGEQQMLRYPAGEHVTVPRHIDVRNVHTMLNATAFAPHASLAPAMRPAMRVLGQLTASPARRALEALIPRLPEGPSPANRAQARFLIECEARGASGVRRGRVRGTDIYGLTAAAVCDGALRMARPGYEQSGGLAPSQAFDAGAFLDSLAPRGLATELDPVPAAAGPGGR